MKSKIPSASASGLAFGVKPRARLITWLVRIGIVLLVVPFILAFSGATYQAFASTVDQRNYPPPGQLVDVGGLQTAPALHGRGRSDGYPRRGQPGNRLELDLDSA
jgi:hypothetical protein